MNAFFVPATFVTFWDGGNSIITTPCFFNPVNYHVEDVKAQEVFNDLDTLEETYIELRDGSSINKFYIADQDVYISRGQRSAGTTLIVGDNDEPEYVVEAKHSHFRLHVHDLFDIRIECPSRCVEHNGI